MHSHKHVYIKQNKLKEEKQGEISTQKFMRSFKYLAQLIFKIQGAVFMKKKKYILTHSNNVLEETRKRGQINRSE